MAWLNHVAIATPRNGTTSHTASPSTGTVASGTLFTPTAGNLLVCIVEGAVTSTTPTGWTLPAGGSAINQSGFYVFYRTAAGSDTFTTTHNVSNYPVLFHFIEWDSTFSFAGAASATNTAQGASTPTLTGLTGTNEVCYLFAQGNPNTTGTYTTTWGAGPTEIVDTFDNRVAPTDGYVYSMAYNAAISTATTSASATSTNTANFTSPERITFAVKSSGGVAPPALPIIVLAPRR